MAGPHARYPEGGRRGVEAKEASANSPTLIGAAIGTLGGPVWSLVGMGAANVVTGFGKTDWNTLNVSAAMLLIAVNVFLFFTSLAVASRCASGKPTGAAEYAGALLVSTPYLLYRAISPCAPRMAVLSVAGLHSDPAGLQSAPAALLRIGGRCESQ